MGHQNEDDLKKAIRDKYFQQGKSITDNIVLLLVWYLYIKHMIIDNDELNAQS